MTKRELLLVKPTMVETILGTIAERAAGPAAKMQAEGGMQAGVWEQFMKQFEALTAMTVKGGVATIPLRGMVTPDDPFAVFYGETNLKSFMQNFDAAMADKDVKKIVLNINSPGGYVYGVEATADAIFKARGKKPIVAYTDSLAASAAYWIASAAEKIHLGSETAEVGSIGVYLAHFDYSEMLKGAGIKVTEITSGEFKGIGSPYAEMTDEEKKQLQADSNYVYTRFVNTVARNRGMEAKDVLKSANGLTFYGSDAIKAGLADSITTLQEASIMTTPKTDGEGAVVAVAPSAEFLAEKARADKAEKELQDFRDKAAKEAKEAAEKECKEVVKSNLGREATEQEVATYAKMDEDGRKLFKTTMQEAKASFGSVLSKAGLTQEQVKDGSDVDKSTESNLMLKAAQSLGFAATAKQ